MTLISKTTTLHVHHDFLYISLPFLHYYDVKMPNFVFYAWGTQTRNDEILPRFLNLNMVSGIQIQEGSCTFDKASK